MQNAPKQVIVMRKDLNMRKGKMVAQGAHASMKVILDRMRFYIIDGNDTNPYGYDIFGMEDMSPSMESWIKGLFTKVCVSVDSEQELIDIYTKAKEAGIPCAMIEDSGLTEFNGVVTKTCIAVGPDYPEKIDSITGHLKLL